MDEDKLNIQQKQASTYTDGPSIILAGAGSGKTRVLTYKVLYLIKEKKVSPQNICMLTFTNKAANEMKKRVGQNLGFIGTFHSLGVMMLREKGLRIDINPFFTIYDEEDQKEIIKSIIDEELDDKLSVSYVLNNISNAKNNRLDPSIYSKLASGRHSKHLVRIYKKYQSILRKYNALDFDDLLFYSLELLTKSKEALTYYQSKYKYILIDEFQDTNTLQYLVSKQLALKSRNITVVGDFSQSIYSWRGADMMNLRRFKEDFPESKEFSLLQNYRSSQNILDYAYSIISKNGTHPILELRSVRNKGNEVTIHELDSDQYESLYIASEINKLAVDTPYNSIAVLYRMNAQSRSIEESLLHYGIPYVLVGGTRFYQRKEIKDILSYMRLLVNPLDEYSEKRAIKIGKKRYSNFIELREKLNKGVYEFSTIDLIEFVLEKTDYLSKFDDKDIEDMNRIENIKELKGVAMSYPNIIKFLEQIALVESEYSESEKKNKNKEGVHLMTLHQAKGLEFDTVFICGVEDGILPHSRSLFDNDSLEEERRLFYVGVTRAQDKLYITYAKRRFFFGRRGYSIKSRFLEETELSHIS